MANWQATVLLSQLAALHYNKTIQWSTTAYIHPTSLTKQQNNIVAQHRCTWWHMHCMQWWQMQLTINWKTQRYQTMWRKTQDLHKSLPMQPTAQHIPPHSTSTAHTTYHLWPTYTPTQKITSLVQYKLHSTRPTQHNADTDCHTFNHCPPHYCTTDHHDHNHQWLTNQAFHF